MRSVVNKMFVIDDLANRKHDCDLLLDSNYAHDPAARYTDLVKARCGKLLGPRYAIMSDGYRIRRAIPRVRDGSIKRVLVYFGGSDHHDLTGRCLQALKKPEFNNLQIDVVVGATNKKIEYLEEYRRGSKKYKSLQSLPDLSDLIYLADLGIGAAGVTTWERMSLLSSYLYRCYHCGKPGTCCKALSKDISSLTWEITLKSPAKKISTSIVEKLNHQ